MWPHGLWWQGVAQSGAIVIWGVRVNEEAKKEEVGRLSKRHNYQITTGTIGTYMYHTFGYDTIPQPTHVGLHNLRYHTIPYCPQAEKLPSYFHTFVPFLGIITH
jgi:hypothetical protein